MEAISHMFQLVS